MATKKRKQRPDWDSIKKYVGAQMRDNRAWVNKKLAAERQLRTRERALLDERDDVVAREVSHHRTELDRRS